MECIHSSYGTCQEEIYVASSFDDVQFYYCLTCGYWSVKMDHKLDAYHEDFTKHTRSIAEYRALLKTFEPQSNLVPMDLLEIEIKENPSILYKISPRKMEDLIAQVFKAYFHCEVIHCGKSHDGGIDLMIVDSDNPILVQVKRRENPNIVEPVNLIRELLGAMYIKSSKRGIFVSTAKKFSIESKKIRNELLETKKLDYFELIDFNRFCDILLLTSKKITKPWNDIFLHYLNTDRKELIHKSEYFNHYFP